MLEVSLKDTPFGTLIDEEYKMVWQSATLPGLS
jgi:hypothetical protein